MRCKGNHWKSYRLFTVDMTGRIISCAWHILRHAYFFISCIYHYLKTCLWNNYYGSKNLLLFILSAGIVQVSIFFAQKLATKKNTVARGKFQAGKTIKLNLLKITLLQIKTFCKRKVENIIFTICTNASRKEFVFFSVTRRFYWKW